MFDLRDHFWYNWHLELRYSHIKISKFSLICILEKSILSIISSIYFFFNNILKSSILFATHQSNKPYTSSPDTIKYIHSHHKYYYALILANIKIRWQYYPGAMKEKVFLNFEQCSSIHSNHPMLDSFWSSRLLTNHFL